MESWISVTEVCRKYGVAEQTVYRWQNKYGGLETSELHCMILLVQLLEERSDIVTSRGAA
ncbi:MAG: helix-turn-helix domain-containing protein [Anaerolineae bacterium]|nr:helix-turn-helix domain-containing protein [Anaerolineae bacterium]